jgi:two-component sensor histidine kinase
MVREHPRFRNTAIIFISAVNVTELDSLRGYELGAVDYVPVPVVPGVLRAKVRVFVDLYRKTRQLARMNDALEARVASRTAELEAAIERQELLAREVDHRARNALAVIQSIVSLTPTRSPGEFVDAIKGRIRAMASAHNLLSETRWRGADLLRLMHEELAPYHAHDRISVEGPAIDIMPTVAQNLALAIHELATNAAKYGALAGQAGRLAVAWRFEGDELVLEWREECDEDIGAPAKAGFGSRVIQSSIEGQLKGAIDMQWTARGLRMTARVPRRHFQHGDGSSRSAPQPAAPRPSGIGSVRNRRILILEDEPLVAFMLAELVRELKGTVIGPFGSVQDAAAGLKTSVDAALLDVNVGDELAYPLAEALIRKGVPVIFVTGYQADAIDPRFARAPVLTKPIEPAELEGALMRVLPSEMVQAVK